MVGTELSAYSTLKKILKPGGVVLLHDAQREKYKPGFEGYDWKYLGDKEPILWEGKLMV